MADLNVCSFTGNLVADPEMRYMVSGEPVTSFRIAVNGYSKEDVSWVKISAFKKLAETCAEFLSKGKKVAISGRLKTSTYEKDGEKRTSFEVIANTMTMLSSKDTPDASS